MITRCYALICGWLPVGLIYTLAGLHTRSARLIPQTGFDQVVPFMPQALWAYLSFFLLVPLAYLRADPSCVLRLRRSMQLTAVIAGGVFFAFPTTVGFPDMTGTDAMYRLIKVLHQFDTPNNCLPSLHGALTILSILALNRCHLPWRRMLVWAWGAVILISVLLLKRHLLIDLSAGVLLGTLCWYAIRDRPDCSRWELTKK